MIGMSWVSWDGRRRPYQSQRRFLAMRPELKVAGTERHSITGPCLTPASSLSDGRLLVKGFLVRGLETRHLWASHPAVVRRENRPGGRACGDRAEVGGDDAAGDRGRAARRGCGGGEEEEKALAQVRLPTTPPYWLPVPVMGEGPF